VSVILGLKLVLVPALIAGITLAGRRWGPAVAGWLSAFPVVSAPILLFITLEQGSAFAANAAIGTFASVLANLAFSIAYAWTATRHSWSVSLLAGFTGYAGTVAGITLWAPTLPAAAIAVTAGLVLGLRMYPAPSSPTHPPADPPNDLVWRMIAGAILVLSITHFSSRLGPRLTGSLAMFPVMASVVVAFSHRHSGSGFAIRLLRGMALGYFAFGSFCLVLALLLPSGSIGTSFAAALTCAALVQVISRIFLRRGHADRIATLTGQVTR
jgi:hypothetical protein